MKKVFAVILSLVILAVMATGCKSADSLLDGFPELTSPTPTQTVSPDTTNTPTPPQSPDSTTSPSQPPDITTPPTQPPVETNPDDQQNGINYNAAFAAIPRDTVLITANGFEITWELLFFYLRSNINSLIDYIGEIHDWSEVLYENTTVADLILEAAKQNAFRCISLEYGAALSGVALSEEDYLGIQGEFESLALEYGGEEAFLTLIWEMDGCYSREMFDYLIGINYLANAAFNRIYGINGELLSDEEADVFAADEGYLMAKHILRLKAEDGSDNALEESEKLLAALDAYKGNDFMAFFDELMNEHSEDPDGLMMFPNGYLFQDGDMVPEFTEACIGLEPGTYSGVVETEYGYHIIYRLPLNYDEIPYMSLYYGEYDTLRYIIALKAFESKMSDWTDSLKPEYTAAYDSLDLAALFNGAQ